MGWLNAPQDGRDNKSRIEDFGPEHPICKLPEADQLIVGHFRKLGVCSNTGMGASSLTWLEVDAYSRLSVSELTAWESEQIINMSSQYCSFLIKGKKPIPPPYNREFTAEDIRAQNESISKILAAEEKQFTALKN